MPFGRPPARSQRPNNNNEEPLTRLAGLYESKSGKALTGNINVHAARSGDTLPFGEVLIELIRKGMEERRPVRALVFENNGKFAAKAPYNLNFTLGYPYTDGEGAEEVQRPVSQNRGYAPVQELEAADEPQEEPEPDPEPVPRPTRRVAPRR